MIEEESADEDESAEAFEVWPENVETVSVFVTLETQWQVVTTPKGGLVVIGLCYQALIEAVWQACGVKYERRGEVMRGLRAMEQAAVPLLNGRVAG